MGADSDQVPPLELDAEYRLMREAVALVRRPLGVVSVNGPEAVELLQGQLTNDIDATSPGSGTYAALLDRKAHVMADCVVLRIEDEELLLLAEPKCAEVLFGHLTTYKIGRDVEVGDESGRWQLLSLLGPAAQTAVEEASGSRIATKPELDHAEVEIGGSACRAVATPWGFDLLVPGESSNAVQEALSEAGAFAVTEAAAEILRVESGRPRYGAEITAELMPAEVGIVDRAVSFDKGCYLGQEPVARIHYKGRPNRLLRGLRLSRAAEAGEALDLESRQVGAVATACVSPVLGPIALAVVRREAEPGSELELSGGGTATVVELPFGRPDDQR